MNHYVIYKPFGTLSQFSREGAHPTLADLHDFEKDVYPVGRLDANSEGLLILTDDKHLNARLLNPINAHHRTYYVQVEGIVTDEALARLEKGVDLRIKGKTHRTKPAIAKRIPTPDLPPRNPPIRFRKNIPTDWLELQVTEGKNRQVRRMTAAVGFPALRLVRHSIEDLTLEGMASGEVRKLTTEELQTRLNL